MHDHRASHCRDWPGEQRSKVLLDPRERASVRLLGCLDVVEDADCRDGVIWRIDDIVSLEALHIADDRDHTILDPARQLFGHARSCLALTNGSVHEVLLRPWFDWIRTAR